MTVRELIASAALRLEQAGIPEPKLDAEWLLSAVTDQEMLMLRLRGEEKLSDATISQFQTLIERRLQREPLQYILGSAPFYGRSFHVDGRGLIPRPETALLAERAVRAICGKQAAQPAVLDLCCGSGCIGITLALECPQAEVFACDLSADALALSKENATALNAKITFSQGDLFAAWPAEMAWDVIISNPPYIPTEECATLQAEVLQEPAMALDGGADGLDFYRRIACDAPKHLHNEGSLLLEIGIGEAEAVRDLLSDAGFRDIAIYPDLQGIERMVEARYTFHDD